MNDESLDVCCHAKIRCFLKVDLVVTLLLLKHNDLIHLKRQKSERQKRKLRLDSDLLCKISEMRRRIPLKCLDTKNEARASS